MNDEFSVADMTPAIGAEINGLDLALPISRATLERLRGVWLDRKVLVFRDQDLKPNQQVDFAAQFCEIDKYPFLDGLKEHPQVAPILKLPDERVNFGGLWHSDTTYLEAPAAGAVLYAVELPPIGGDTLFANMELAWETLAEPLKSQVADLRVICSSAKAAVSKTRESRLGDSSSDRRPKTFNAVHPLLRTHPETGEKILFVNEAHAICFEGWSEQESEPILRALYDHQRVPEFQCRIRWSPGAVVMWDNRSTHHYPVNDYHGYRRLLYRVSLKGDRPV